MTKISENDFGFSFTESQKPIKITNLLQKFPWILVTKVILALRGPNSTLGKMSRRDSLTFWYNYMWLKVLKVREFLMLLMS